MLREKASKALGWSALDQVLQQGLVFVVSLVLARMIAPEAFGTVALLALFVGMAGVFMEGGLTNALIQRQNATREDESTVFWFNVGVGTLLAAALALAAPWFARFFEQPVLEPIARWIAFTFFLSALNSVQSTLFMKRLDFKTPLKINLGATIAAGTVGISMAVAGWGIWALVGQSVTLAVVQTVLFWSLSPWRPLFVFSLSSFRALISFGGYLFLARIIDVGHKRFYTLLIGRWFGVYELGLYNRAESLQRMPSQGLSSVLNRVAFPLFSQTQGDHDRLLRGFRLAQRGVMFINLPMMLGLAMVAEPLILTLYGETWAGAAPILAILALAAVLWPIHLLNVSVLQALGQGSRFLRLEIVKKIIGLSLILAGARFGVLGIAWAVVASSVVSLVINTYYTKRNLGFGFWAQIRDLLPTLACACGMGLAVAAVEQFTNFAGILQLSVLVATGVACFVALAALFRLQALREGAILFANLRGRSGMTARERVAR